MRPVGDGLIFSEVSEQIGACPPSLRVEMMGTILRSLASKVSTEMRVSDEFPADETPMDDAQLVRMAGEAPVCGADDQACAILQAEASGG